MQGHPRRSLGGQVRNLTDQMDEEPLKIKFSEDNREVYAEIMSSRLLWASIQTHGYVRYLAAMKAQCTPLKSRALQKHTCWDSRARQLPQENRTPAGDGRPPSMANRRQPMFPNTVRSRRFDSRTVRSRSTLAPIKPATIRKLFPGEEVVSLAHRIEARGGSAEETRIWVLVKGRSAQRRIMELKQYCFAGDSVVSKATAREAVAQRNSPGVLARPLRRRV